MCLKQDSIGIGEKSIAFLGSFFLRIIGVIRS